MSVASSQAPDSAESATAPSSVESLSKEQQSTASSTAVADDGGKGNAQHLPQLNRHLRYLVHLPIPQEECYRHECNQRLTLLWGFGDARAHHKQALKKVIIDASIAKCMAGHT